MTEAQQQKLGANMIAGMQKGTVELLTNPAYDNRWFSGYLSDDAVKKVEQTTGKKIICSAESGEYFYKFAN